MKVLVEGLSKHSDDTYTGRTEGNKIVIFKGDEDMIGKIVEIEIKIVKTWHLEGEVQI